LVQPCIKTAEITVIKFSESIYKYSSHMTFFGELNCYRLEQYGDMIGSNRGY
jgi:hypothetical protein